MRKLLIIKAGTTYPAVYKKAGDFDDMIMEKTGFKRKDVVVCPVYERQLLPDLSGIFAVIITGSHAMVTKRAEWSVYLAGWIRDVAFKNVPLLGICYAHQLIAQALGGDAGYHPRGPEMGTVLIEITQEGKTDPLMQGLPLKIPVHVTHAQTVTALPSASMVLAYNQFEPHHAVAFGPRTWGLQFHPEFTSDIVRMYIEEDEKRLEKKGYDTAAMYSSVVESPYGGIILKRFIELAKTQ
jgi:GMP synthase (glutamine-hydrolysing)